MTWGLQANVVERFTAAGAQKANIAFARETYTFDYAGPPIELVAMFRRFYGPTMNAFEAAEKTGRAEGLERELESLFTAQNASTNPDTTSSPTTYLKVTGMCTEGSRNRTGMCPLCARELPSPNGAWTCQP
jgi:hypothetical protein